LTYHTSSGNFNHFEHPDLSYTAVIDYAHINLTPLGKFVMPPPMSEK
jgi:IKI3 family